MRHDEEKLDALFSAYRQAFPDIDAGPEFMPKLWERIESRRPVARTWRWFAGGFVTASAAICLLLAAFVSMPSANHPVYTSTYVDALENDQDDDNVALLVDFVRPAAEEGNASQ